MSDKTAIQWTHVPGHIGASWNPTTGCTRVSPGCDHCYAFELHDMRFAKNRAAADRAIVGSAVAQVAIKQARVRGFTLPFPAQYDRPFSTVQILNDERFTQPLRARSPHAYFVDSMSDLFHEDVPNTFLDRVFAVMALTPQHVYQVLTKRPERMRKYFAPGQYRDLKVTDAALRIHPGANLDRTLPVWPLPNVWLGVSVEDQQRADERIPILLGTPAAVRFLSCEPLLTPLGLTGWLGFGAFNRLAPQPSCSHIDWVIVGGESGPHARPFDLAWARGIRDQCAAAGVPLFVKQLGAKPVGNWHPDGARQCCEPRDWVRNRHGSDPAEWPEDLRVREFPR